MSKNKTTLPFVRAYSFLLEKKDLIPAEKLVLIFLCKFWPSPFWGSNSSVALSLGYKVRFVEKIIKRLKIKGYIRTGYAHKIRDGKNHTVRIVIPMCFAEKCKLSDFKMDTVPQDGQDTVLRCAQIPSDSTKSAVLQDDLLERNRRENKKATPLPLPAEKQAKALKEKISGTKKEKYSELLSHLNLRKVPALTPQEFEARKRNQIKALLVSS